MAAEQVGGKRERTATLPLPLPLALVGWLIQTMPTTAKRKNCWHWQNLNCPTSFWPRLARVRGSRYARATLPSPRLHGAARGLRARSAPRAATGACPTTIRDVLRVQSPPGAPHAARRAHFHPASPPPPERHNPPTC